MQALALASVEVIRRLHGVCAYAMAYKERIDFDYCYNSVRSRIIWPVIVSSQSHTKAANSVSRFKRLSVPDRTAQNDQQTLGSLRPEEEDDLGPTAPRT